MELSTPSKQHNPISLIRNVYYKNKTQFNKKQINTTHPITTTSQRKKGRRKKSRDQPSCMGGPVNHSRKSE